MLGESQRGHLSGFRFSDEGLGLTVVVVVEDEDEGNGDEACDGCRTPV